MTFRTTKTFDRFHETTQEMKFCLSYELQFLHFLVAELDLRVQHFIMNFNLLLQ